MRTAPSAPPAPGWVLHPAVRVLWRSARSIQFELGGRATIVDGLDASTVRALTGRTAAPGRLPASTRSAVHQLADAGFVWRSSAEPDDDPRLAPPWPRLAAELGAISTVHGEQAAELLNARRHYSVTVEGNSRVAAQLAAVLAAAGVGRVHPLDHGSVRLHQAMPGGLLPGNEGQRFAAAATEAITRAAPETDSALPTPGEPPDLAILAVDAPIEPERRDVLHQRGQAHLAVGLGPDHGVVGPLVIPGLTSCLRCGDRHRLDRDPAWSALAVQLGVQRPRGEATAVALATVIGGIAALQALAFLDGEEPATIDGTLEMHLPDWRIRRRSWPVHPDCGCTHD